MTRRLRTLFIALGALGSASLARAQALDSVTVGMDTRYRWRGFDRGDGVTIRASASFALAGFSVNRNAGERHNFTADLGSRNPVANRAVRRGGDQYDASFTYGFCFTACDQNEWRKRTVAEFSAATFAVPNVVAGQTSTYEGQLTLRRLLEIPKIGGKQVGFVFYPFIFAAHDFRRFNATYVRGGIGTEVGPANGLTVSLDVAAAMSDWPGRTAVTERDFAYHGADFQIGIDHDKRIRRWHLSTHLAWDVQVPVDEIARPAGLLSVRWKLFGPAWMF